MEVDLSYQENKHHKDVQTFKVYKDRATQMPEQKHKAIQVCQKETFRCNQVQIGVKRKDNLTSPIKFTTLTATSSFKIFVESDFKSQPSLSAVQSNSQFFEEKYDSKTPPINTPSIAGCTVDCESFPYTLSSHTNSSLEEENKKKYKSLHYTLIKIRNKPELYIGLPKKLYFLIELMNKHINVSEEDILLCLMKLKLNSDFLVLADDFDLSISQVRNIFFNKMPEIESVLSPFIIKTSPDMIKRNLPIIFRYKYNHITHILDCLEIKIRKPRKSIHQALTWSEDKKTHTIKYLISYTPDGLVNFVSIGYGGKISDRDLLEESKFFESLHPGSTILAHGGFKHLDSYIAQKGFGLVRLSEPAGEKLTKAQVQQAKHIASLRIHVERLIQRLREFEMFKKNLVISSKLIGMLDHCVIVACALINLQDTINLY